MNHLFKKLFVAAYSTLIFSLLGIFFLTNAFANVGNKKNSSNAIKYTHNFQTVSDTAAIVQKCMDMPELQQYFTKNNGTYKQVYVMQFPLAFSTNLGVTKFQKKVLFEQRGAIYTDNADVFFMFKTFSISGNTATVAFYYQYDYTTKKPGSFDVTVTLQKTGTQWAIISTQMHKG